MRTKATSPTKALTIVVSPKTWALLAKADARPRRHAVGRYRIRFAALRVGGVRVMADPGIRDLRRKPFTSLLLLGAP